MPKLEDARDSTTFQLPSFSEAEVTLYEDLLVEQNRKLMKMSEDEEKAGMQGLIFLIKDWNFEDDEEETLEVNEENLGKLPSKDLKFLTDKVAEFMEEEGKEEGKISNR